MGFSVAAAAAIIVVSVLISVEIMVGSVIPNVEDFNYQFVDLKERAVEQIQTDINITTVDITAYGLNYNHSITIENSGSICLNTSDFVILINGTNQEFSCSVSYLYAMKSAYFNVSNLPGDGPMRLKAITGNGISDIYEYII